MGASRREALHRYRVATCTAQRLGDLGAVLEREFYALDSLSIPTDELAKCAEHIATVQSECIAVADSCETAILGKKGGRS